MVDKEELLTQIKNAMKAKDKIRLSILRQVNQSIKQIEVDERRDVEEADIVRCIKKLHKQCTEEIESLETAGKDVYAERIADLSFQVEILNSLLPEQIEGKKLEELCDKIIDELKCETRRDMGRVMGALTASTNGNFNKPEAAKYLGSRLS